ncbi:MAG: hypothetical protein AAES65_00875 [Candidatus Thiodiazotropha sp. (ex. Lucinoma kazani)]
MVAERVDTDGTSPGKEVLTELIRQAAPCVILIDELVAFIRQLELGKQFKAGTFDSNISFIQALSRGHEGGAQRYLAGVFARIRTGSRRTHGPACT